MLGSLISMLVSALAYWFFLVLPLATSSGFGWSNFRKYFDHDQYAYLAIAVNVSKGNLANVEPFTETGTSHYPRLYYVMLGHLARLFDADIVATWQVVGLALQLAMVLAISWLFIRLTQRPVLGLLGFVPGMLGVLAAPASGSWYHPLDNHGVLWGPYGTMFTLNGEAAGMVMAVMAACLLVGFTFPVPGTGTDVGRRTKAAVVIGACSAVGLLANVQTYSFLTAVYFLAYVSAAFGLLTLGRRLHAIASGALLIGVLLGGTALAGILSPLATLVCGLAGAVPGIFLLLRRYPALVAAAAAGLACAAAPTIIATLTGIAQDDPFLEYRALSSEDLGVPFPLGLVAAAVPVLFLGVIFRAGIRNGNKAWLALSTGIAVAWPVVASNDLWGANQEPYRFWLDSFVLASAVSLPVLVQVLVQRDHAARSRRAAVLARVGAAAMWGVVACSFLDYVGFAYFVHSQGTASFEDEQARAISAVAQSLPDSGAGPVLPDPCIDPFRLKALTGAPTAYYNLGLAWPNNEQAYRELLEKREDGILDQAIARQAGVGYVMIDTACEADWHARIEGSLIAESGYGTGQAVTLWKTGP